MKHSQTGVADILPETAADADPALASPRLASRITLVVTVLTLGFVLTVGGLSYVVTREQVIDNQDISLENQASLYAQQIASSLRSITTTLESLAKNSLILNSLMDSLTRQTALTPFLKDFSQIGDMPVTLLMTDFEGQPVAGNSQLASEAPGWRKVLETGRPQAMIGSDGAGDYLFVAEPIFYSRTLSPEGVLLSKVALADLQSSLPSPSEGNTTLRLVYPKQGGVVSPTEVLGAFHGSDHLAYTEILPLPTKLQPLWIAAEVSTDRKALTASLHRLLLLYAAVGTGIVLAVFALARAGAHCLARPLRELEAVARSVIESGSLEHRFTTYGVFELEQLGRVFNQMLAQLGSASRQLQQQAEAEVERNRMLAAANAALMQEIGERQRAEERLLESEERFRLFMRHFPGLAYIKDSHSRTLFASQGFKTYFDFTPTEMLGKTNAELFPPEFADQITADDRRILESGQYEQREEHYGGRDWSTLKFVLPRTGQTPLLGGFTLDITERKRAEEALRQSRNLLQTVLDTIPTRVFWKDRDSRYLGCNRAFALDAGVGSPDEMVGQDDYQIGWREQADLYRNDDKQILESGNPKIDYEEPQTAPDGRHVWLRTSKVPLRDADGVVFGILGTYQDITERKQAEAELAKTVEELRVAGHRQRELLAVTRREQGRLRALLAAMSVGILFEDNRQCVEYLNPAFLKMWAIDETLDLVGHPMREILEHSTHRFARPDHASRYVLQVLDTHEISERFEIDLYDGRILTQMSYPVMDNEDRLLGRLWLYDDITHERQTAQQLLYLAERDPLTGLCNRHSFQKHLEQKIAAAQRSGDCFAVIYFDLDEFKAINDTFGHRAGDMVLVRTAGEITTQVRATEIFARLGGDEFAILSTFGIGYQPDALPARIVEAISAIPFRFRGTNLRLTASVGIALFPEHGESVEDLVAHADMAMYQAKNQGKNTWALYDPSRDSTEAMVQRLNWNSRIAQALEGELFELHFQGVYRTDNRVLSHLEVLIRMRNPDDPEHPILPGQFIRLAEKSGQVLDIDRWVLKRSIALLGQHADLPPLAVNLSGRTFDDPALPQFIRRLLVKHGVDPQRLFVELTETAAVSDVQDAQRFIEAIQQLGCGVCLDDFGSGFSTFAYLKYLNVKVLKIDGLFVRDLPNNYDNQVFIRAMVEVARGLRKTTVAEFVEDAATLDMLRDLGVDLAQGYHLDRPNAEHSALIILGPVRWPE